MYIYSGKCRQCEVGIKTGWFDIGRNELFTGDIIALFCETFFDGDWNTSEYPEYFTTIVKKDFQSYSDGSVDDLRLEYNEPFIMGIKSCESYEERRITYFRQDDNSRWFTIKLKDHADVVNGEKWTAFGFNYQEATNE